jgi:hypothetical protein
MKYVYTSILALSMALSQPAIAQNEMTSETYYTARNTVSVMSSLLLARAFTKDRSYRYSHLEKGVVTINAVLMAYFLFCECSLRAENNQ